MFGSVVTDTIGPLLKALTANSAAEPNHSTNEEEQDNTHQYLL